MTQRICIFGASGATGLALTQQALACGHDVTVFVRSETAQVKLPPGVTVVVGSLLDRGDWRARRWQESRVLCYTCAVQQSPKPTAWRYPDA